MNRTEIRQQLELRRQPDGSHDIYFNRNRIGVVCKGWTTPGGNGWVTYFNDGCYRSILAKKSLDQVRDAIVHRIASKP